MRLDELAVGKQGKILAVNGEGALRRHLLDMGLTPGARIECVGVSPGGDPRAFLVRGAVLALRREDCLSIILRTAEEGETWA